ncbi:MAG: hypothetical protein K2X90_01595 [Candidatus Babeliaceae bacterium]|nr:hypothetical protein [Candidatus Babeliaceae bacterium]
MELRVEKNILYIATALVLAGLVFGFAYYGFTYYKAAHSAKAYDVFMQHYSEFEKQTSDNKAPSNDLIDAVSASYQEYKNSAYGPFLIALKAEIQAVQGNKQDALSSMTQAVSSMGFLDPVLYYTYATKLALMQLDAAEPAIQTKGRQSLEKLSLQSKNPVRDMAWFYIGYQALLDNDNQGVQAAWSRLFDAQKNPLSVWGMRAQQLLNYTA